MRHIFSLQQTVKDHISGRLLPLISHHNLCSDSVPFKVMEVVRQWDSREVCNSSWCCLDMWSDRRKREKKSALVFPRVRRGACVRDVTACALYSWACYHAPAGDKVCVAHSYTAAGACGMMGAGWQAVGNQASGEKLQQSYQWAGKSQGPIGFLRAGEEHLLQQHPPPSPPPPPLLKPVGKVLGRAHAESGKLSIILKSRFHTNDKHSLNRLDVLFRW